MRPAIVIAAGGAGTRIGGAKADRLLAGQRLLDWVVSWARRHGDAIAIAGSAASISGPSSLPVLADREEGVGPVAALYTAMLHAQMHGFSEVLLVGCDMPFLPDDLVPRLQVTRGELGVALPSVAGRLEPLAGLWRCDPEGLKQWMDAGGRSLRGFADHAGLATLDWPRRMHDPFFNINTPDDLAAAEARLTAEER